MKRAKKEADHGDLIKERYISVRPGDILLSTGALREEKIVALVMHCDNSQQDFGRQNYVSFRPGGESIMNWYRPDSGGFLRDCWTHLPMRTQ